MKFLITPQRIAEACSVMEYLGIQAGNINSTMSILPKLVVDDEGKYLVTVTHDADGDIADFTGMDDAWLALRGFSMGHIRELSKEILKACNEVVNPPKGGG